MLRIRTPGVAPSATSQANRKSKFTLEVFNHQGGIVLKFCSSGHVDEWVSRGEPDLPKNTGPEAETWLDRVISVGSGIIVVMVGLMIFGA